MNDAQLKVAKLVVVGLVLCLVVWLWFANIPHLDRGLFFIVAGLLLLHTYLPQTARGADHGSSS